MQFPVRSNGLVSGDSYTIETGDTLSRIARKHGIKLSALLQANGLSLSSVIRPGQTLTIPTEGEFVATPESTVTSPVVPAGATTHSVQKGENLSTNCLYLWSDCYPNYAMEWIV